MGAFTCLVSHTYLDFFHFLEGFRDHAKLQPDQGNVPLYTSRAFVHDAVVVLQDCLSLGQTLECVLELAGLLLHLGQGDRDMRQELRVRVFLKLSKRLQCLVLELDGLLEVLLTIMDGRNLDVTVANLLRLGAKCHLVELPGLTKHVQSRFMILLSQVDLADNLQDLPV